MQRAAQFCAQVRAQAMDHQQGMIAEARNLSKHAANERRELLSSCQRKAEETVSMLRSQLEAEKANVEEIVKRTLHSEREKMLREATKQQDVPMGHARSELKNAQQQLESLRGQAVAAERERDASMQQLAAERIRATQLENHCASLTYNHETIVSRFD
eukprot:263269-Amphidinium_carterae.2